MCLFSRCLWQSTAPHLSHLEHWWHLRHGAFPHAFPCVTRGSSFPPHRCPLSYTGLRLLLCEGPSYLCQESPTSPTSSALCASGCPPCRSGQRPSHCRGAFMPHAPTRLRPYWMSSLRCCSLLSTLPLPQHMESSMWYRPLALLCLPIHVAHPEFINMMKMGIVRHSSSPWASPLHVVAKANGGWRPCGHYRQLNYVTQYDRCPIPHIHSFNAVATGASVFSVVDLVRGYHQIPM